jgi:hypothetical protein
VMLGSGWWVYYIGSERTVGRCILNDMHLNFESDFLVEMHCSKEKRKKKTFTGGA